MNPRISIITLGVEDLERSLVFYQDGLGFPTTRKAESGVIDRNFYCFLEALGWMRVSSPKLNLNPKN